MFFNSGKKPPPDVDANGVFATTELDLKEVDVYGFDYDYTLAHYKESVDHLIYNLGREVLVKKLKVSLFNLPSLKLNICIISFQYPEQILSLHYQPGFAVRGLHYDILKGLLLKVDSFAQVQLGSVYRGLTPVPDKEVLELYKHRYIPVDYLESHNQDGSHMVRINC